MRIRTVKPEYWSHPILAGEPDEVRLAGVGLLNIADDHGYFLAKPALIRSALWPLDEDSTKARRTLARLSEVGYIEVREHPTHGSIGWVVNFTKHQRVDRPSDSKIKAYFDSSNDRRMIVERSLPEQGTGNREQGVEFTPPPAAALPRAKDEWRYVQHEVWVSIGRKAGCSISASNWESWSGAITRTGDDAVEFFAHAETMPADKRWFDKIEASMARPRAAPNGGQGPKWMAWIDGGCVGPEPEANT